MWPVAPSKLGLTAKLHININIFKQLHYAETGFLKPQTIFDHIKQNEVIT